VRNRGRERAREGKRKSEVERQSDRGREREQEGKKRRGEEVWDREREKAREGEKQKERNRKLPFPPFCRLSLSYLFSLAAPGSHLMAWQPF
jgi:hypothetical protein